MKPPRTKKRASSRAHAPCPHCGKKQHEGSVVRDALALLLELASIAHLADIDLGAAVIRKFNATSEKRGATERLTA